MPNGTVVISMQVLDELGLTARQHALIKVVISTLAFILAGMSLEIFTHMPITFGRYVIKSFKGRKKKEGQESAKEEEQILIIPATEAEMKRALVRRERERKKAQGG